jgi:hypothetical protein
LFRTAGAEITHETWYFFASDAEGDADKSTKFSH